MKNFCKRCCGLLTIDNWYDGDKQGNHKICKICIGIQRRDWGRKLKQECFNAYGGNKCACCKIIKRTEFLTLDHINNDGAEERRTLNGKRGIGIYS